MNSGSPQVAVVGAGIVGTSIAYALRKRGCAVTLIDREEPASGCSAGNSGAISPASVAPLAMPGVLASVPGMLLDSRSPLYLPLGYLPQALPWLARFVASARPQSVQAAAARLADIHQGALQAHEAMCREIGVPELFLRRGHLHLYPDEAALAKDATGWRLRTEYGYAWEKIGRDAILALEPHVAPRYQVGVFMQDQGTILNPRRYVEAMAHAFAAAGGCIARTRVDGLRPSSGSWEISGEGSADGLRFDHVVMAAGVWSKALLVPLGLNLPLESQRGYHLQFEGGQDTVSRTVVLADRKVFVTPMEEGLRVGGTVEIAGTRAPPNEQRARMLGTIVRESFSRLADVPVRTWMGHRPCMPDSVPLVGQVQGRPGLWLAVGHGHLGLTDSLNTARWIAQGITGDAARAMPPKESTLTS